MKMLKPVVVAAMAPSGGNVQSHYASRSSFPTTV